MPFLWPDVFIILWPGIATRICSVVDILYLRHVTFQKGNNPLRHAIALSTKAQVRTALVLPQLGSARLGSA